MKTSVCAVGLGVAVLLGVALLAADDRFAAGHLPSVVAAALATLCIVLLGRNRQRVSALLKSREDLNRAQAVAHIGSWHIRSPRGEIDWSDETYRIFGLPRNKPVTLEVFMKCVHPHDRQALEAAWTKAVTGAAYDLEHRILIDGEVRWVRERAEIRLDNDGQFIEATGTVEDITQRKATADELTRSEQRMRELGAHHERLREAERAHIAREIHDELGQYLSTLRMDAAMLQMSFGPNDPRLAHRLAETKALIDQTIASVRRLAASLRPPALDLGLASAAEWLVSDFRERTGLCCDLTMDEAALEWISEECATMLFRVLQEALTNVVRHSRATCVSIALLESQGGLLLTVSDDGVGFDMTSPASRESFGIMGMRERTRPFGGQVDITSTPGTGTEVRLSLPQRAEFACNPGTPYAPCHECTHAPCLPLAKAGMRC